MLQCPVQHKNKIEHERYNRRVEGRLDVENPLGLDTKVARE